ncbi:MAG: DUF305 domain-containing protein [bacterium]
MQNQNPVLVGLCMLLVGLILGYGLRGSVYPNVMSTNTVGGSDYRKDMHGAMGGMMSGLAGKTGADLEKSFLEEMIVHHEGAVEMAQTLLKGTKRPELVKLGNDIVAAQTGEIEMMQGWLKTWFK